MWLSRVWRRGCGAMRRIFFTGPTTIALPPVYFPFIGPVLNRDAFMRTTLRVGDPYQLLHQGDLFTTGVRLSTSRCRIHWTRNG